MIVFSRFMGLFKEQMYFKKSLFSSLMPINFKSSELYNIWLVTGDEKRKLT